MPLQDLVALFRWWAIQLRAKVEREPGICRCRFWDLLFVFLWLQGVSHHPNVCPSQDWYLVALQLDWLFKLKVLSSESTTRSVFCLGCWFLGAANKILWRETLEKVDCDALLAGSLRSFSKYHSTTWAIAVARRILFLYRFRLAFVPTSTCIWFVAV